MKRSGPIKRGKPLARSRLNRKQPAQGFPEEVRLRVRRRSNGVCEAGSSVCTGKATHLHHRKLRRFKDHSDVNCLHVCAPCHTYIHDTHPEVARMMAWLLHSWEDPIQRLPIKGDRWNEHHRSQR